jgi:hypothetical protein
MSDRGVTVRPPAGQKSAERQSSQKNREHGADRIGGIPKGVSQQAREDGFKNEARDT